MKYTYPPGFADYDEWVEYSENARREWESNQPWKSYTPEQWARTFPDRSMIESLLLSSIYHRDELQRLFNLTEKTFSQNLIERLMEEGWLDATLGEAITSLDKKIKKYRRMLGVFDPPTPNKRVITDSDIAQAREVPMESLLDQPVKRGFVKCPWHEEKTPSCKVYPDHIHCFSCGKSQDTIGWIMETQKKDFINSVKYLCKI